MTTPLSVTPQQFESALKNGYLYIAIDAYSRILKVADYVELQCWGSATDVNTIEMIVTYRQPLYNHIYRNNDPIELVRINTINRK